MRVLITAGIYPPDIGGPATYAKILKEELPKKGLKTEVLPFSAVRHLPNVVRQISYFFKVLRVGREADVLYAQDAVSVGWPTCFANLFLRKKFVVKIVGDHVWEQGRQRFGVEENLDDFKFNLVKHGLYLGLLRVFQVLVVRHADLIITPSEYLKGIVLRWGVEGQNIRVINNSFELKKKITREEARAKLGFGDELVIVSPGRLVPWKGFLKTLEMFLKLLIDYPDARLVILGEGPQRKVLENRISELGVGANVAITGALSHEDALAQIAAANVFLLNTSYEGLSHFILEAMSLSTPVVTTDVGGNPELIEDGTSGVLVDVDDVKAIYMKVKEIIESPELAKRLVVNAQKVTEGFSLGKMITKTAEALNS